MRNHRGELHLGRAPVVLILLLVCGSLRIPARAQSCTSYPCTNNWLMNKCFTLGEGWDTDMCMCSPDSPIVVDIAGNGFSLTDLAGGVSFDINGDGRPDHVSWTNGTDDAWLSLNRNGNGIIDNGRELFGNFTPQPPLVEPNGFVAPGAYDLPASGGNGDGKISSSDAIFLSLRLWQDANHNGFSEPAELHTLTELALKSLELDIKYPNKRISLVTDFATERRLKMPTTPRSAVGLGMCFSLADRDHCRL